MKKFLKIAGFLAGGVTILVIALIGPETALFLQRSGQGNNVTKE